MRNAVVALAVILGSVATVHADSTTLTASPSPSVVGQTVTFTAAFAFHCADGVATHYFLVDGRQESGTTFALSGQNATEALSISTLTIGSHQVAYHWETSTPGGSSCSGDAQIPFIVQPAAPPPPPEPSPRPETSPSPKPSPQPSPSPSQPPTASAARPPADPGASGGPAPTRPLQPLAIGGATILLGVALAAFLIRRR